MHFHVVSAHVNFISSFSWIFFVWLYDFISTETVTKSCLGLLANKHANEISKSSLVYSPLA